MPFVEGVKFQFWHAQFLDRFEYTAYFRMLLSVNALHALVRQKYFVFSTEVSDLRRTTDLTLTWPPKFQTISPVSPRKP